MWNKLKFILLPIIMVIILTIIFIVKFGSDSSGVSETSDKPTMEAFLPDSESELSKDKISAYKDEIEEKNKQKRIQSESQVKNSDFFREMNNDDVDTKNEIVEDQKTETNITPEELYERTVMKKENITQEKPSRGSRVTSTGTSIGTGTSRGTSTGNSTGTSTKQEIDPVKELYEKTTNSKSEQVINLPETGAGVVSGKRTRSKSSSSSSEENLIRAAIHGDQEISTGTTVRMRLIDDYISNDISIPKNTIFYGISSIQNDRLQIKVTSIKYGNSIENVKFTVYDQDAIQGLNLPDNIKNELRKKTTESAIDNIQPPVTSGGIVNSAINATKSVLKKDQNQIRVSLKANYNIFIK